MAAGPDHASHHQVFEAGCLKNVAVSGDPKDGQFSTGYFQRPRHSKTHTRRESGWNHRDQPMSHRDRWFGVLAQLRKKIEKWLLTEFPEESDNFEFQLNDDGEVVIRGQRGGPE
jgi:hypothetical protein